MIGSHYLIGLLLRGWWSAQSLARIVMFVVFWAALFDLRVADQSHAPFVALQVAAAGVIAWLLAGLPAYLRAWTSAGSTAHPARAWHFVARLPGRHVRTETPRLSR